MNEALTVDSVAPQARSVDAGRGLGWFQDAWTLFLKAPGMWIVLVVVAMVAIFVLALVPFVGTLAVALFGPVLLGSFLLAARKVAMGGELVFDDLFTAFRSHLTPLLMLGGLLVGATLAMLLLVALLGGGALLGAGLGASGGSDAGLFAAAGVGLLAILVIALFSVLMSMALWFAPALVVFKGVAPFDAVKLSCVASLKNLLPFLIYGLLYLVAAFVASIPFGLGWVVLLPVLMLTVYVGYTDVFESAA